MAVLPQLKAVVFDLDGTLLSCPYDFAAMREAVVEIAFRFGVSKEKLACLGILEAINRGSELLPEQTRGQFRAEAEAAVLALELTGAQSSVPLIGAAETLIWLSEKGLSVGIITRNSEKVVGELLRCVEFNYDVLLAREAVSHVKPHPGHLLAMLERLDCQPNEAVMVGDHIWDMHCGRQAGLISIGVTTGVSPEAELYQQGAQVVLMYISYLPNWLKENFSFPGKAVA